jgi:hypothetical protein
MIAPSMTAPCASPPDERECARRHGQAATDLLREAQFAEHAAVESPNALRLAPIYVPPTTLSGFLAPKRSSHQPRERG